MPFLSYLSSFYHLTDGRFVVKESEFDSPKLLTLQHSKRLHALLQYNPIPATTCTQYIWCESVSFSTAWSCGAHSRPDFHWWCAFVLHGLSYTQQLISTELHKKSSHASISRKRRQQNENPSSYIFPPDRFSNIWLSCSHTHVWYYS